MGGRTSSPGGSVWPAPVGSFLPNRYGLYDLGENVWERCTDWNRADYYQTLADAGRIPRNPVGLADSFDPSESRTKKRVQKGGSYLCTDQYCKRYMPGGRG
jgi:formylglycine-generating enzyme required for sulfatase activity